MTNVTEYLGREMLSALPLLGGLETDGADYELFRNFCRGTAILPRSEDETWVRGALRDAFGISVSPNERHCNEIWRAVADRLLLGDLPAPSVPNLSPPPLPGWDRCAVDCPPPNGADSWAAWRERSERSLFEAQAVRVTLSSDHCAVKPNLWRVERILRGEIADADCMAAQAVDFAVGFCRSRKIRLCLTTACTDQETIRTLRFAARRHGGLPPLVWERQSPLPLTRADLLEIARLVSPCEGVLPILIGRNGSNVPRSEVL